MPTVEEFGFSTHEPLVFPTRCFSGLKLFCEKNEQGEGEEFCFQE